MGGAPHGHWKTLTLVAALRHDGIIAPCVFDGPINAQSFLAYVREALVSAPRPGGDVALDNLSSHKGDEVRQAIRAAGARLIFLPPRPPLPGGLACPGRILGASWAETESTRAAGEKGADAAAAILSYRAGVAP